MHQKEKAWYKATSESRKKYHAINHQQNSKEFIDPKYQDSSLIKDNSKINKYAKGDIDFKADVSSKNAYSPNSGIFPPLSDRKQFLSNSLQNKLTYPMLDNKISEYRNKKEGEFPRYFHTKDEIFMRRKYSHLKRRKIMLIM